VEEVEFAWENIFISVDENKVKHLKVIYCEEKLMPSHGALSKAGKVRSMTGVPDREKSRSTPNPRVNNRKAYRRRILLGRNAGRYGTQGGQYNPFSGRRR
jgi:ribosomal protein S30